jgi:hypothetical protein
MLDRPAITALRTFAPPPDVAFAPPDRRHFLDTLGQLTGASLTMRRARGNNWPTVVNKMFSIHAQRGRFSEPEPIAARQKVLTNKLVIIGDQHVQVAADFVSRLIACSSGRSEVE